LIIDAVAIEVEVSAVRQDCGERGQCCDDQPDRRLHHHERRPARLIPDAVVETVRQSGVVHDHRPLRNLAHDRAAVGVDVIVPLARVVMAVIRLELFLGGRTLLDCLPVGVSWDETSGGKSG
jgi:hypothetical protein